MATGVLALTACTSEDVVDISTTQGNAIGFENVVNKSSRVVDGDLDNASFDNFLVYGYYIKSGMSTPIQIFNGVPVHKIDDPEKPGTKKWSYDGVRYWVPGCTYYFYAYSCADVALANGMGTPVFSLFDATNTSVDNRALTLSGYICDSSHQHDLVTAENESITALEQGNQDVSLAFSHALCKVKAVFSTDFSSEYKVYVSNVYISSFYNQADFNVGTGTWSGHTVKGSNDPYVMLNVPADSYVENKADSKVTTTEAFVIPKQYETINNENAKIHFTITIKKGDGVVLERNIIGTWSPQWNKGNIYQYSINISGSTAGIEPIVFAAVQSLSGSSSWEDSTSVTMVFGVDTNED